MFVSGLVVFLGLVFMFFKLGVKHRLIMLGKPLLVEIMMFIGLNALHYGTVHGLIAAAVACLLWSMFSSSVRWCIGWLDSDNSAAQFKIFGKFYHAGHLHRYKMEDIR